MASPEDFPNEDTAAEAGGRSPVGGSCHGGASGGLAQRGRDLAQAVTSRQVIVAAVAVGAVAAAVIGVAVARDRRKSEKVYTRAVRQMEDARDALASAASELPERSRAVLHRVTRR